VNLRARNAPAAAAGMEVTTSAAPPAAAMPVVAPLHRRRSHLIVWLSILGPGIIATAAGNDAGGILTYIQAGAGFRYSLIWAIALVTISYYVVEEMCARMGAVTGKGLADLIRENYGVKVTLFAMVVQLVANLATTITEFAGISAACRVFGCSDMLTRFVAVPGAIVLTWVLLAGNSYARVERVFLLMSGLLFAYVIAAFKVHPNWFVVAHESVFPTIPTVAGSGAGPYVNMLVALIGTTIAPYQQFYIQSAVRDKGISIKQYAVSRWDTLIGCVLSNIISIFIVIACAATLYAHKIYQIDSADQASIALLPIAGPWAKYLFGIGLLGASLLAAVVVPLTTAYAVTESLGWETGVGRRPTDSPLFYLTYGVLILLGGGLVMLPNLPLVKLIVQAQVLNAALLPVELVLIVLLSGKKRLMGRHANSSLFTAIAWLTVAVTAGLSVADLVMALIPH